MIKNLIFDFGDVFINLDKQAFKKAPLDLFKIKEIPKELDDVYKKYEMGKITTKEFLNFNLSCYPNTKENEIITAWNCILKDFPAHRLDFIKNISKKYDCYLLSNTNALHIKWIREHWGERLYAEFKSCFIAFYLSHKIGMRKPNIDIYEFVLKSHNLHANETLFIDDTKENTDTANLLGIKTWNIMPSEQDVSDLLTIKKELF